MKIPFDAKYRPQIERGEYKVIMTDHFGYDINVRIICWDNKNPDAPIVGLIESGNEEIPAQFDSRGGVYYSIIIKAYPLKIVIPEPEMTVFENAMLRYVQDGANARNDEELILLTKKHSKELLSIAKKELTSLCPDNPE